MFFFYFSVFGRESVSLGSVFCVLNSNSRLLAWHCKIFFSILWFVFNSDVLCVKSSLFRCVIHLPYTSYDHRIISGKLLFFKRIHFNFYWIFLFWDFLGMCHVKFFADWFRCYGFTSILKSKITNTSSSFMKI